MQLLIDPDESFLTLNLTITLSLCLSYIIAKRDFIYNPKIKRVSQSIKGIL